MNTKLIADALRALADALEADAPAAAPAEKPAKAAKAASKAKAKPEPTTEAEPEEEAPTVTKVEVIQVLQSVAAAHGREKIDKILGDFNVDKVSKLPESDYADLVEVAKALL